MAMAHLENTHVGDIFCSLADFGIERVLSAWAVWENERWTEECMGGRMLLRKPKLILY
jgi:hypothetical protein